LTQYTWDALGNLLTATQNGGSRQRTFAYDSLSRLTSSYYPESNGACAATTFGYDADGLLTSKVSPLPNQTSCGTVTATYGYDELYRMLSRSFSDGTPSNSYYYDKDPDGLGLTNAVGRMSKETNPRGWIKDTAYDATGRLKTQLRLIDSSLTGRAHGLQLDPARGFTVLRVRV
jgi:YD repeat-containing protein